MLENYRSDLKYSLPIVGISVGLLLLWPDLMQNLLVASGFMPHGSCYLWQPRLVSLHVVSDLSIGSAYVSISATLAYLVYRARKEIPFHGMFLAFGLFIVACGTTHFMEVWTLWHPTYWLAGGIKLVTAVVSVATAILLPPLVPKALSLVEAAKMSEQRRIQLETANQSLQEEITERLRIEKQLRLLESVVVNSYDAIVIAEAQPPEAELLEPSVPRIVYVNQAFTRTTGYTAEEVLGKTPHLLLGNQVSGTQVLDSQDDGKQLPLQDNRPILDPLWTGLEQQKAVVAEVFSYCKEGKEVWNELSIAPVATSGKEVYSHWVAVQRDITERKRAEGERVQLLQEQAARAEAEVARERTARLYKEAEEANRLKDEFLSIVSHELRTPLNAMLGWSQMLRTRTFDSATTNRALETIERNAKIQVQLIDDILDTSRIIRGKIHLSFAPVKLPLLVEAAIEAIQPSLETKNIELKLDLNPAVGWVSGDMTRLQQVVNNLLSNAVKSTPAGGKIWVELELEPNQSGINSEDSTQQFCRLRITDTGIGIKAEFLPLVFEYFRQADSSFTRGHGGLGLGLRIVRHLVQLHGGSVSAYSAGESQGASFTVLLPLSDQPQDIALQLSGFNSQQSLGLSN